MNTIPNRPQPVETRTISTDVLDIGYETSGPEAGTPVILLQGWPDDVRTWDRILPRLHAIGWRTIAPYLRGFGPTRFKNAKTFRSGQLSALGSDVLDLADGLGLETFAMIGHDWGARAAYIASCLAPERITHCTALSEGAGQYYALQAQQTRTMADILERYFKAASVVLPMDAVDLASVLIVIAHGVALQRPPAPAGAPDSAGRTVDTVLKMFTAH